VELVKYASSLNLFLEILTHGWWEDQTRIEQLALANPWRVTVSFDAASETHSKVRGRDDFFEKTSRTIQTLLRMREQHRLGYEIRLKTVLMEHNLDEAAGVARFATRDGVHVFYQPIEQTYNTAPDPLWFCTSPNWPRDTAKAERVVGELLRLKREGLHIGNSEAQLEAMKPYFRDPETSQRTVKAHNAHERRSLCSALTMLQFQANGDVTVCAGRAPVGNIRQKPVREIWRERPQWWQGGCCLKAGAQ
jgi:MoaA/NifB/PqqE/SkfB family radical SAM enzyme